MIKEILFLILFTVAHALATILMIGWVCGEMFVGTVWDKIFRIITWIFMTPIIWIYFLLDPDGDRSPQWLQAFSYFLNSFVWAVLILLLIIGIKRLREKKQAAKPPNPSMKATG